MSNQRLSNKQKQKGNLTNNWQDSGSEYHREHADNVAGYGDLDPTAKNISNVADKTE